MFVPMHQSSANTSATNPAKATPFFQPKPAANTREQEGGQVMRKPQDNFTPVQQPIVQREERDEPKRPAPLPASLRLTSPILTPPTPPFLQSNLPKLTEPKIDWRGVRQEFDSRKAPFDDRYADGVRVQFDKNYQFFLMAGFSRQKAVDYANKTLPSAVGAGLSRDYPNQKEQFDRETGISTTIIPIKSFDFDFL